MNDVVTQILKAVKTLGAEDKNVRQFHIVFIRIVNEATMPIWLYCPTNSKVDGFDASQTIEIKMRV